MVIPVNPISIVIIVCWTIFYLYWLISSFFVKRSVIKRGTSWILWRVAVIVIVVLLFRFIKPETTSFFKFLIRSLFSFGIIGAALTVIGLITAVWARINLGSNWSGYVTYKENQELVTTGPYRLIRHPIYTGMILMFTGTVLYSGSLFLILIFLIVSINFIIRTKREEKIMIELFDEKYLDYIKRTKRLIPWIY